MLIKGDYIKKQHFKSVVKNIMAEREGFEPSVQQAAQWFSRPPP